MRGRRWTVTPPETGLVTALPVRAPGVVRFTVPGPPVAAARPRITTAGGFARAYAPRSNVEYAQWVQLAFREQHPDFEALDRGVPVKLQAQFWFPRPKAHFGTGRNAATLKEWAPVFHTSKPDIDNLFKILKDALKGVAWHDDSQVCVYDYSSKRYVDPSLHGEPGTAVTIGWGAL